MSDDHAPNEFLDLHLTQLAGWLVNTVGKALLLGALVVVVGALATVFSGEAGWVVVAGALSPVVLGMVLYTASAPFPIELAEDPAESS